MLIEASIQAHSLNKDLVLGDADSTRADGPGDPSYGCALTQSATLTATFATCSRRREPVVERGTNAPQDHALTHAATLPASAARRAQPVTRVSKWTFHSLLR